MKETYQFFGVWGPTGEDLYVRTAVGASNERADAEKGAALTEGELIAIGNALHGMGYDYLADKLRAILAAKGD